jgi:aryl-alcohol dehydrogenase-like predicted oxidoreductase
MLPEIELAPGYRIPRLIRGTWQLHEAARTLDKAQAVADLVAGCEAGFTAIEAADTYDGVEDLLGALRTELGGRLPLRVHTRITQMGAAPLSPETVRARVDRAGRRLRQERLDLVQLQWWNLDLPGWIEAGQTLASLREAGALAHIGVANFPVRAMTALLDAGVPLVSNQVQVSLLDPRAGRSLAAACRARGVHILGYGPLAGGFLSEAWLGKPAPATGEDGAAGSVYRQLVDRFGGWDWFQALLAALSRCAERHGVSIVTVALAWTLQRSVASALLVGFRDQRRIPDYLAAAALRLTREDIAEIEAVLAERTPPAGDVADLERKTMMTRIQHSYAAPD